MWKVSWLYEKVHDFLVVPLYYFMAATFDFTTFSPRLLKAALFFYSF